MREAVDVAREFFLQGLPLARMVDRRLSLDLDLFTRGGLRVLRKIEQLDYDVLRERPSISRLERAWLLLGGVARTLFGKAA
jgi:phytoene/squalene synthetase